MEGPLSSEGTKNYTLPKETAPWWIWRNSLKLAESGKEIVVVVEKIKEQRVAVHSIALETGVVKNITELTIPASHSFGRAPVIYVDDTCIMLPVLSKYGLISQMIKLDRNGESKEVFKPSSELTRPVFVDCLFNSRPNLVCGIVAGDQDSSSSWRFVKLVK